MTLNLLLFKEEFKNTKTIIFRLSTLIFLIHSLIMIILYTNNISNPNDIYLEETTLQFLNGIDIYGMFILFSVIVGINLFRYLHNKKKVDFYHSLPLKREQIFVYKYFVGIISIIFAIIIINLFSFLIFGLLFKYMEFISIINFFRSIFYQILGSILIFTFTVLSTILANNLGITLLILIYLPNVALCIYGLLNYLAIFLNGVTFLPNKLLFDFTPYFSLIYFGEKIFEFQFEMQGISNTNILTSFEIYSLYIINIIIIFAFSCYLFKNRKNETTNVITFKPIKYIIYYFTIFFTGTSFISLINSINSIQDSKSNIAIIIINIIATLIFIIIVSMILGIIFKVKFNKKIYNIINYVSNLFIICIVFFTFYFDAFNLNNYIPKNIKHLDFYTSYFRYNSEDNKDKSVEDYIIELDKKYSNEVISDKAYFHGEISYNNIILKNIQMPEYEIINIINDNIDYYINEIYKNVYETKELKFFESSTSESIFLEDKYLEEFLSIWEKDLKENGVKDIKYEAYLYRHNDTIIISSSNKDTIEFLQKYKKQEEILE